ncbi:MAG TPA: enoyl-CoA hydratase-related protein, partial [Acidimicrobiales bacterium]|nr:enoyl-CoA hydratase-related protein [Acidimicrobiales bacterium]
LVSACDLRLCARDAKFSVRETKIAIVADLGSLQRLPRIIGAGHLAELAYTGKDIDAGRALAIGLVNAVFDTTDDLIAGARELASEIARNSPLAVQGTKAVLAANDGRSVDEGLEFVARWNTMYLQSNDLREAMTAFVEKRPPVFHGD